MHNLPLFFCSFFFAYFVCAKLSNENIGRTKKSVCSDSSDSSDRSDRSDCSDQKGLSQRKPFSSSSFTNYLFSQKKIFPYFCLIYFFFAKNIFYPNNVSPTYFFNKTLFSPTKFCHSKIICTKKYLAKN